MECLVVIPARGGSKGIPRKNVLPVAGKSLVARAVHAALGASAVGRVVVSTDSAEIGNEAEVAGATVITRPDELSGDTATSESAVLHALRHLETEDAYKPDLVVLMQCTTPMTTSEDLDGAIATLLERGADSCFTAVPFYHFAWQANVDGWAEGVNHDGRKRVRRQDLPPQALENGAAYVMRSVLFRKTQERFCGNTVLHMVPGNRGLEIDEPIDLQMAEVLLRNRERKASFQCLPAGVEALALDFDGVLTDNAVLVSEDGRESVRCSRSDGMGLQRIRKQGLAVVIISKERNGVVQARAKKLGVPCFNAIDDKVAALRAWAKGTGISLAKTVYVGNDLNDLNAMGIVGCSACPADAHPDVLNAAHVILQSRGGHGAVRELCDALEIALNSEH